MVSCWLFGDSAKLVFYLLKAQPLQFIACALFQITFDALILAQFRMYKKKPSVEIIG